MTRPNNRRDFQQGPSRRAGTYIASAALPKVRDSLVAAIEGDAYGKLDRSWKQPDHSHRSYSVAAVSEARRLDRMRVPIEAISEALDGHGVQHTMGQLQRWLSGVSAVKGYPVVRASDEPYLVTPPEIYEMNKRIALVRKMLDDAGLTLVKFADKKDNRITVIANAGTDETRIFSISQKDGDFHGDKNEAARMKRFARECGSPATQLAEKLKPVVEQFKHVAKVAPPEENEVQQDPYLKGITAKLDSPALPQEEKSPVVTIEKLKTMITPMTPPTKPAVKKSISTKLPNLGKLSMADQYRLIEWLKTQNADNYKSIKALHVAADKYLGAVVPTSTMNNAMQIAGIEVKPAKREYVRAAPILARAILKIQTELGMTLDEDLIQIARETT